VFERGTESSVDLLCHLSPRPLVTAFHACEFGPTAGCVDCGGAPFTGNKDEEVPLPRTHGLLPAKRIGRPTQKNHHSRPPAYPKAEPCNRSYLDRLARRVQSGLFPRNASTLGASTPRRSSTCPLWDLVPSSSSTYQRTMSLSVSARPAKERQRVGAMVMWECGM